jgi:predicted N-acyltransferase
MRLSVSNNLNDVPAAQWNALAGTDIPFLRHEFLSALETHHCVGETAGWIPQHLLLFDSVNDEEKLVGAVPLYLKTNSYGELVFDWAWADAYYRIGKRYYPKLVAAIPYTPATGPRLLISPKADQKTVTDKLIKFSIEHAKKLQVSSLHWLFPHDEDLERLEEYGFMPRLACQFHWKNAAQNNGYRDFDDYLDHFTSSKRKKIKRERRQVRHSGYATLSLDFFLELASTIPKQLLIILAEKNGEPVASAICFCDDKTLYGRHWGCDQHFQNLHFEACYYQGLEYCIEQGLSRFDPGAQGEHKISRGFLPTPTWSAHWIADPEFSKAIEGFLHHETREMQLYIEELNKRSPFSLQKKK